MPDPRRPVTRSVGDRVPIRRDIVLVVAALCAALLATLAAWLASVPLMVAAGAIAFLAAATRSLLAHSPSIAPRVGARPVMSSGARGSGMSEAAQRDDERQRVAYETLAQMLARQRLVLTQLRKIATARGMTATPREGLSFGSGFALRGESAGDLEALVLACYLEMEEIERIVGRLVDDGEATGDDEERGALPQPGI